ncbi:tannase/feruloyl esterase family alpha/beta hydrolase [Piscinibacter koreensis]|uniref:Tannase/feruloyl esterase family alpha/beta hydrolase n=1 Tax=Piscinibacter koreensis TaxID=2742824 RepID=A0A7Y6NPM1_9BURK|nr:tannase/feruloyl esterase family alpha/beta hydrolase [Schlegelella koreensis]NUZ07021.1 tannase/feruloyl esterase family alpha/beta hydrolase [Schlegelella koreensis]
MTRLHLSPAVLGLSILAALAGCGGGDGDDDAAAVPLNATEACANVASAGLAATTLAAQHNADGAATVAGTALNAHCVVDGKTNERIGINGKTFQIGFRLRMPDNWNGRLVFVGGGGNDGSVGNAVGPNVGPITAMVPAIQQGYAVVSTDGGHTGGAGADFGSDSIARVDHAYNAFDVTAVNAKALIAKRYGRGPDKSYFIGGSGGGRQGMMFTQRFPSYFDGVIASYPAMRVASGGTIGAMWNHIQFTAIAPVENGAPILSKAYSDADLNLTAAKILEQCDALDGTADGMVNNFKACHFDPVVLQCPGAKTATCLTAPQVTALRRLFSGPVNSAGTSLYVGQVTDPGISTAGWRAWALGSSTTATPDSRYVTLMQDALRWEFFTPPDPTFNGLAFNFDTDPARMAWTSSIYDTYRDDRLTAYKARGGKLMFVHGLADPIFSAKDTVDYVERLAANNGGMTAAQAFVRLFLMPGAVHGPGGRSTDLVDLLTPMVEWVEKGNAPDSLLAGAPANHAWFPNRTRPLCPYPTFAKYRGSGSIESAASFSCEVS